MILPIQRKHLIRMIRMKRRGPKHLQRMRLYGQKHRRRRRHRTRRHRKQKRHIRKHRRPRHRTQRRRKQKRHIRKHRRRRHRTRRRRETEAPYTEAPETEAPSTSGVGQQIADFAVQYVGNPYVWGGTSLTEGADCSGFVQTVFANFGLYLSRTAESQSYGGTSISLDNLQPGDLLFYNSTGSIDHVAIYIGGGQIVHAANSRSGIIISNAYYQTPVCARRYC